MRRALCVLAVTGLVAAGCGSDDQGQSASEVLGATADKLGTVRSGELDLSVLATPGDSRRGVGIELEGPFELAKPGRMPVAKMRYSRVIGDRRTTATLESDGAQATITTGGRTIPVPAETARTLVAAKGSGKKAPTLGDLGLDVASWIEDAKVQDGPQIDGVATDRVTGRLRAGTAVRDVLGAVRRAGGSAPESGDTLVKAVDESVRSARAEIVTGREDRILRRVDLRLRLAPARELKAALPGAGAVSLTVRLRLSRPKS